MTYEPTELESRAKRDWQGAFDALNTPKQIAIIGHARPDGDAMGSTLALNNHLSQMGHHCQVLYPDPWPDYNAWMPGISSAVVYSEDRERADKIIAAADWIFCLDFGSLSRIEDLQPVVEAQRGRAKLANLDHHADNEPFADYEFCEVAASSTCELVYRLLSV
ncbi:MAG: DHH family phosphoesterase, partial [Bacteroidota bacterium]